MKKTYKIDVDCANCANKMEEATKKTPGVQNAVVNFMVLKMTVEFESSAIQMEADCLTVFLNCIVLYIK